MRAGRRGSAGLVLLGTVLVATPPAPASPKGEWQLAFSGSAAGENLGFSVSRAGDFDGDGHQDLIVGSPFDNTLAIGAGRATILFGGTDPAARLPLRLHGDAAADDQFGISVAGGGDLDGDGHDDVAVGARFSDRGAADGGAVFVFFGGQGADAVPDRVLAGTETDDWFGQSLAIVPDIDGDGDDELLVGAPYNDDLQTASGRAVLFRGGPGLDGSPSLVAYGDAQAHAHFGWAVASAGDVNGDGHGDWIVGARLYGSGTERARGRAYVFLGGTAADGMADRVYTGERKDDWFGSEVAGLGDLDGDGFDEVGVGAIYWDLIAGTDLVSAAGRAYVFRGGATAAVQPLATVDGASLDDQMGFSLAGPLMVATHPRPAWVVGAHFSAAEGASAAGAVQVLALDGSGGVRRLLESRGETPDAQWGHDLAVLRDHPAGAHAYAGSAPYADQAGHGAGEVVRAVPRCVQLSFQGQDEVQWTSCGPQGGFGLLEGPLAAMACTSIAASPPLFTTLEPSASEVVFHLIGGQDAEGGNASAGYGSDGLSRPAPSCP